VANRTGGKRTARSPSGTLNAANAAANTTATSDEFGFLPPDLISPCRELVKRYHAGEPQPWKWPVEIFWRADACVLLRHHSGLRTLFEQASRTRRAKPAKERQWHVVALVLACEILVRDLGGWSAQFPDAKRRAEKLFAEVSTDRGWLVDTYGYPTYDVHGRSAELPRPNTD
jgi:hypothetical protein